MKLEERSPIRGNSMIYTEIVANGAWTFIIVSLREE